MANSIYIISGLGADERVFCNLQLPGIQVHHIRWIKPFKSESIDHYTKRLFIDVKEPNPNILGLSFGGIVALELATQIPLGKLILLSTVKNRKETPFWFLWAGILNLHQLIPISWLKKMHFAMNWFFSVNNPNEKTMLNAIICESDDAYLRWAIDKIINRKNTVLPEKYLHIHGNRDRLFPSKNIKNASIIKGGGHLMVLQKAGEIEKLILDYLQK